MPYPIPLDTIQIELADFCNLKCVMCDMSTEGRQRHGHHDPEKDIHSQKKQFLPFESFKKVIDSINDSKIKVGVLSLFWLGEPLINPEINKMLEYLNRSMKNFDGWMIHTNANVMPESTIKLMLESKGKNVLHFSIDAGEKETYEKIRKGGNYETVVENIQKVLDMLKDIKTETRLILQFIILHENFHEAGKFINFWKNEFEKRNIDYTIAKNYDQHKKNTIFLRQEIGRPDDQKELDELHQKVCDGLGL
jgi:wyosine [tRNA(Phe)-imidazoG37] synthetase (radical SAM superfamily)